MQLLNSTEIKESLLSTDDDSIFIDPILEESQVSGVTVDLRLGYDFLVSVMTRKPYIAIGHENDHFPRSIGSYFQETRREIGDGFVLYPNQVVLATTIEYISLPQNVYIDVLSRSSYTRLGLHMNNMVQPGFRGCVPLELFNHGNNAIELVVGSRICQARFMKLDDDNSYLGNGKARKYYGDVRPTVSKADMDNDIEVLAAISNAKNKV